MYLDQTKSLAVLRPREREAVAAMKHPEEQICDFELSVIGDGTVTIQIRGQIPSLQFSKHHLGLFILLYCRVY